MRDDLWAYFGSIALLEPPHHLAAMADGAGGKGCQLRMECYFDKERRPGRPRRKRGASKAGRKPRNPSRGDREAAAKAKLDKAIAVQAILADSKPKMKRASLSDPATRSKLAAAVEEWDLMSPAQQGVIGKTKWLKERAKQVGVSESCLREHTASDLKVRKAVPLEGQPTKRGRPSLMSAENRRAVQDVLASADLGNQGMTTQAAIEAVQETLPGATKKQAENIWFRTIKPEGHKNGVLTKSTVKAQQTTSLRSMVTVRQQRRYYDTISAGMSFQAEKNLPTAAFKQVRASFIANYDEKCFQASPGEVRIVGAAQVRARCARCAVRPALWSPAAQPHPVIDPGLIFGRLGSTRPSRPAARRSPP